MDSTHGRSRQVDESLSDIWFTRQQEAALIASGGNAAGTGTFSVTTAGSATIHNVIAAKLYAKASGIFFVSCLMQYSAVAADVVTYSLLLFTDAVAGVPLSFGGTPAGPAGWGSAALAQPGNVVVNSASTTPNGIWIANNASGITLSGATQVNASNPFVSVSHTIGTGAAGDIFSWSGIITTSTGNVSVAPFSLGTACCAVLAVTNSVAARAVPAATMSMFELPYPAKL